MNTTNLGDLFKVLYGDVKEAKEAMNKLPENRAFYARSYVRAYASWIEGTIWMYKRLFEELPSQRVQTLPLEYQLYLKDIDWSMTNGKPKIKTKKIGTKDNVKGFFQLAMKLYPHFRADISNTGFSNINEMFNMRDRLMHPSDNAHLCISDDELDKCEAGRTWFISQIQALNECIDQDSYLQ